jgi:hypothetical protein
MVPYPPQRTAAIPVVKAPYPAADRGVYFIDHPVKRDGRPLSLCQFSNPVFDLLTGSLREENMGKPSPRSPSATTDIPLLAVPTHLDHRRLKPQVNQMQTFASIVQALP